MDLGLGTVSGAFWMPGSIRDGGAGGGMCCVGGAWAGPGSADGGTGSAQSDAGATASSSRVVLNSLETN